MGKKTSKTRHQASKAALKSPDREREEVLNLYRRLKGRERYVESDEIPVEFREEGAEKVDVGGLIVQLKSPSPDIILDALKKIEKFAGIYGEDISKTLPTIVGILRSNSDTKIRYEATKAISKIKDKDAIEALIITINNDRSEKVKEGAVKALGLIKAERCFHELANLLNETWDQTVRVRKAAAFALGRLDPKLAVNILSDSLVNDPDAVVRREAAESIAICLLKLEKNHAGTIVTTIASQLEPEIEQEHEVRISIVNAMTVAENLDCVDPLIKTLKNDPHPRVRGQAANALAHFFDPRIEKALIESLEKEEGGIKKRIALALAQYALKNPLSLHDDVCDALIYIQKTFPRGSYIWKEAVKALPAC